MTRTVLDGECRPQSEDSTAFTMNHLTIAMMDVEVVYNNGLELGSEDIFEYVLEGLPC